MVPGGMLFGAKVMMVLADFFLKTNGKFVTFKEEEKVVFTEIQQWRPTVRILCIVLLYCSLPSFALPSFSTDCTMLCLQSPIKKYKKYINNTRSAACFSSSFYAYVESADIHSRTLHR